LETKNLLVNKKEGIVMRSLVTKQGVIIPPEFFKGIKEVEISQKHSRIIIIPISEDDPIYELGKNPITVSISDASENTDNYIYSKDKL